MLSEERLKEIQVFYDTYEKLMDTLDDNISFPDAQFIAECRTAIPELLYTLKYVQDEHAVMYAALRGISMENDASGLIAEDTLKRLNLL